MRKRLRIAAIAAALACACGPTTARAQDPPREYDVKAAFLFNFAKFVAWPDDAFADAKTPLVIGIVGDDPFGAALEELTRGERVDGRPIVLKRLRLEGDTPKCHILFIAGAHGRRLAQLLGALKHAPVLTVGEAREFTELGGVIRFTKQDYRVGFDVNLDAATRGRLRISSKLLSVAGRVQGRPGS